MALAVKNPPAKAGDLRDAGSIPGSARSPGGRNGNPLPHSCLENPRDRGAWQAAIHGVTESRTWLSDQPAAARLPKQARPHPLTHSGRARGGFYLKPFTGVPRYLGTRLNSPGDPKDLTFTTARLCLLVPSAWSPNSLNGFLAVSHQTPSSTCHGAFAQAVSPRCNTDESLPLQVTGQTPPIPQRRNPPPCSQPWPWWPLSARACPLYGDQDKLSFSSSSVCSLGTAPGSEQLFSKHLWNE